jgi:hypothetical protein
VKIKEYKVKIKGRKSELYRAKLSSNPGGTKSRWAAKGEEHRTRINDILMEAKRPFGMTRFCGGAGV